MRRSVELVRRSASGHEPGRAREESFLRILHRRGPVSLGLIVPRSWAETHSLRVGSVVRVGIAADESLWVRASNGSRVPARRATLVVGRAAPPKHVFRWLLGAYLSGAVELEVRESEGLSPETRAAVRTFLRRTAQWEVLSEEGDRIEMRDVSDLLSVPLARLLERMGQVVLRLHEDAGRALQRPSSGPTVAWAARDDEIDRQAWSIERTVVRLLEGEVPTGAATGALRPLDALALARHLEAIADQGVLLGGCVAALADPVLPRAPVASLVRLHKEATAHTQEALAAVHEDSPPKANLLLDRGEALRASVRELADQLLPAEELMGSLGPRTAVGVFRILDAVDGVLAHANGMAQVVLDRPARDADALAAPAGPDARRTSRAFERNQEGGRKPK